MMDDSNNSNRRIHPLVAVAAGSVILASAVGVAAMTGLLPSAHSNDAPLQASQPVAALPAPVAAPTAQVAAPTAPAAAPSAAQLAYDRDLARRHELERQRLAEQRREREAQQQAYASAQHVVDPNAGVVEAITPVAERSGQDTGLGAVGGAVAGGLLGNQFGRGNGRIATTVLGALGGGVAGNAIESNIHTRTEYQVSLRMDDGSTRTILLRDPPNVGIGQHVHLADGGIYAI